MGRPLFERIGKREVLVEVGEVFLAFASRAPREVVQGMRLPREITARARPMTGAMRIGAMHAFNVRLIPQCVTSLLGRYPTGRVGVDELDGDGIAGRLLSGDLDEGIARRPAGPTDRCFEPPRTRRGCSCWRTPIRAPGAPAAHRRACGK